MQFSVARSVEIKAVWGNYGSVTVSQEATVLQPVARLAHARANVTDGLDAFPDVGLCGYYGIEYKEVPLWTYFELAEAHQWLFLNDPQRVWATLKWFWEHQASPGLFTWWEDETEGNAYGGWDRIRGWVKPAHVTPHYWTNAEMLSLQLDMLAYVDESASDPVLVLGGGMPQHWTIGPISAQGIETTLGTVSWLWREGKMSVVVRGASSGEVGIRLGDGFPSGSPVHVEYIQ